MEKNRWFILPAMGATASMYDALRGELGFKINFINWPEYRGEKSYSEIARRVITENRICDGDIVGGSSLGGMVALEIAQKIQPKAVVLIGSAIKAKEVQNLLSLLSPLAVITPISLVQVLAGKHKNLVAQMFAKADPKFIRAMCTYLRSWPGVGVPSEIVFRVHGKKDHIVPCPSAGCEVVENAGHFVAITHFKEIASFLEKISLQLTNH